MGLWGWLYHMIREYDVNVLMGDFSMSLFEVTPALRSRGLTVDLEAWFPWKSLAVTPHER